MSDEHSLVCCVAHLCASPLFMHRPSVVCLP
nr:MAG TPA: hypothetical protein [Caudoviricetes sp.]